MISHRFGSSRAPTPTDVISTPFVGREEQAPPLPSNLLQFCTLQAPVCRENAFAHRHRRWISSLQRKDFIQTQYGFHRSAISFKFAANIL